MLFKIILTKKKTNINKRNGVTARTATFVLFLKSVYYIGCKNFVMVCKFGYDFFHFLISIHSKLLCFSEKAESTGTNSEHEMEKDVRGTSSYGFFFF